MTSLSDVALVTTGNVCYELVLVSSATCSGWASIVLNNPYVCDCPGLRL